MHIRFSLAALALVLLSGALAAQVKDYAGYPEERVRLVWGDNHFPDELYTSNRVIFHDTQVLATTRGMQISGSVITDFNADRVPAGEELPSGQLTGISMNIELYSYDMVLERDPKTNKLLEPTIDPKVEGNLVAGQMQTVTVDETFGRYGLARFKLPELTKPLAPGLYRLVARVRLQSQEADIRKAFKWCSDMYGSRAEVDPDTQEVFFKRVMADKTIHEEVYHTLIDEVRELKDVSLVWIGSIIKDGLVELVAPEDSTDRKPANYLVWSYHHVIVGQLIDYEYQLDNVDKLVDDELANKLKLEGVSDEMKEKWKAEAIEDKKRIRVQNAELIAQNGGRTTAQERALYTSGLVVKTAVIAQVGLYQEYLAQRYWCLTDGWLLYRGWHTVNAPGYNIWEAVTDKDHDNLKGRVERLRKLKEASDAEGGLKAKWEKRRETWKYYPSEISKLAFNYLRTKEESGDWDAEKFTEKDGDSIVMDAANWAEYRSDFIIAFIEDTDKILNQVTTTNLYCVQTWPKALAAARDARDDVLSLTYSWEYYIRVDMQKEEKDTITEAWKREDQSMPSLDLSKYYKRGTTAPGTLKARFDGNIAMVKSLTKNGSFMATYHRAIDAEVKEKDLPGQRPPSAPNND